MADEPNAIAEALKEAEAAKAAEAEADGSEATEGSENGAGSVEEAAADSDKAEQSLAAQETASVEPKIDAHGRSYATGKRKDAVARVWIKPGSGKIEVNGRDMPGLLHRLTRTLAELGLQIQTATVSTYGERVVDVFYVKDLFGLQVHNEARLTTIRDQLLEVFDQVGEAAE